MVQFDTNPPTHPGRVVLLGANGFIAKALAQELAAQSVNIISIGSKDIDLSAPMAATALASKLQTTDTVVMLSAITPDKGRGIDALTKNLAMMQNVCAALEQVGAAHLVYFSSDAVYNPKQSLVNENTLPSPADLYGVMHLAREQMAKGLNGIPTAILRVTMVYGADDTHNSYGPNRFWRLAKKNGHITLFGNGEETRDHICIEDVAKLAALCILHKSVGTLNLATGTSHSFKQVAQSIASLFDPTAKVLYSPRADPITHRSYDTTKLISLYPSFKFTPLEEGLKAYLLYERHT
jgi:UDP-glucose 4-epimerase